MSFSSPTPDLDKIRETLKKLAVLAKRGEENERQTALGLLQRILQKYNLSISDLKDTDLKEREFNFTSRDNLTILSQCIWSLNPDAQVSLTSKSTPEKSTSPSPKTLLPSLTLSSSLLLLLFMVRGVIVMRARG